MEFTNEFTIPLDIDRALEVLTDLERVAPCFPGATLEEVDGDTYSGRVKVKLGPMSLTYSGDATVTEVDHEAHTARIEASGREKRGSGTAAADVHATLTEGGDGTIVNVTTDINITGRPAQFGRGVMDDVGAKIIDRFAENLREHLEEEGALVDEEAAAAEADAESADAGGEQDVADEPTADASTNGAGASSDGPRRVEQVAPRDDALDLADVAGEATMKRLAPVLGAALVLLVLWLVLRGDDDE